MKRLTLLISIIVLCLFLSPNAILAMMEKIVTHRIYAELLQKYVKDGLVDYQGFKNEEKRLDQYLQTLERVEVEALPHEEQFAFYINAYNAWTIKLILTKYPDIKSIKDLGSLFKTPWKKKILHNC